MTEKHCRVKGCPRSLSGARRGLCQAHYGKWKLGVPLPINPPQYASPEDRLWAKVIKDPKGCWIWTGAKSNGYGHFRVDGQQIPVHRFAYELFYGPIDDDDTIDHTCHNLDESCNAGVDCLHRACVRPEHLEAVPIRINTLRGRGPSAQSARRTHCKYGHPFAGDNLGATKRQRLCLTCNRLVQKRYRERKRAERLARSR